MDENLLQVKRRIRAVYPDLRKYLAKHMKQAGYHSIGSLQWAIKNKIGHEFLRLVVNGMKLPSPQNTRILAKALKLNYVEFLCVIENSRLRKAKVSKYVQVVPASKKMLKQPGRG